MIAEEAGTKTKKNRAQTKRMSRSALQLSLVAGPISDLFFRPPLSFSFSSRGPFLEAEKVAELKKKADATVSSNVLSKRTLRFANERLFLLTFIT